MTQGYEKGSIRPPVESDAAMELGKQSCNARNSGNANCRCKHVQTSLAACISCWSGVEDTLLQFPVNYFLEWSVA